MYIQHTHPTHETPKAESETLSELYRACIRKLRSDKASWTMSPCGSPAPDAH